MKYIYNREKYNTSLNKLNELMDSDNINVDFSDTLMGGTLHRLMGFFKSKVDEGKVSIYSKQLDRLLASIVAEGKMDAINDKRKDEGKEEISFDDIEEDGSKLAGSILLLKAYEEELNGNSEEALKLIEHIPEEVIETLPQMISQTYNEIKESISLTIDIENDENASGIKEVDNDEERESEFEELGTGNEDDQSDNTDDVSETDNEEKQSSPSEKKGKEVETIKDLYKRLSQKMHSDKYASLLHKNIITEEQNVILTDFFKAMKKSYENKDVKSMKKIELNFDQKYREFTKSLDKSQIIKTYKSSYDNLIQLCKKCNIDISGEMKNLIGMIKTLSKNWDDTLSSQIKKIISSYTEKCKSCNNNISESYSHMIKINEDIINLILEKEATDILTQKKFNKLRKDIEKESKKWKVTSDDLKIINERSNKPGSDGRTIATEITGNQSKAIMDILAKAKDSMTHTKPYDEMRKKQKRWYDKLSSSRSLNRKAYKTWVKKVNEIISYYKDQLPKKVMILISDSLDKKNIENDYVNLHKEFLGLDIRRRDNKNSDSRSSQNRNNSVNGYEVDDIVEYEMTNGKMNKGKVIKINDNDVEISTKKNGKTFIILKSRIKEVEKANKPR